MKWLKLLALAITCTIVSQSFATSFFNDVAFVLITQNHHPLHVKVSNETKEALKISLASANVKHPKVFDLIFDWPVHGGWSIFKLFPRIKKLVPLTKWFVFLPETSQVDLKELENVFSNYPHGNSIFLGRALEDSEFKYVDVETGFAMSSRHLKDLIEGQMEHQKLKLYRIVTKFGHNLSDMIYKFGSYLQSERKFCHEFEAGCAIYQRKIKWPVADLRRKTHLLNSTLFAVKTCPKFHAVRLNIVKKTWGKVCPNIIYVSDKNSSKYETVALKGSNINLCEKTMSIINFFANQAPNRDWRWLIIVDDDTLLGISKVMDLINLYDDFHDSSHEGKFVTIGERFGYRHFSLTNNSFDFHAGGSGMIFNYPPEEYDLESLIRQSPASFHKFEHTDPEKNYNNWFKNYDMLLSESFKSVLQSNKEEL